MLTSLRVHVMWTFPHSQKSFSLHPKQAKMYYTKCTSSLIHSCLYHEEMRIKYNPKIHHLNNGYAKTWRSWISRNVENVVIIQDKKGIYKMPLSFKTTSVDYWTKYVCFSSFELFGAFFEGDLIVFFTHTIQCSPSLKIDSNHHIG